MRSRCPGSLRPVDAGDDLGARLRGHVGSQIGPIAKPRSIHHVPDLPETRSGEIMRRLLRDAAEHREIGNATTLADASVTDLVTRGMTTETSQ